MALSFETGDAVDKTMSSQVRGNAAPVQAASLIGPASA